MDLYPALSPYIIKWQYSGLVDKQAGLQLDVHMLSMTQIHHRS